MNTKSSISVKVSFYLLGRNLQDRLELNRLWNSFSDPESMHDGEKWQYILSEKKAGTWKHCFRHRNHPSFKSHELINELNYNNKVTLWIDASEDWVEQMKPVAY